MLHFLLSHQHYSSLHWRELNSERTTTTFKDNETSFARELFLITTELLQGCTVSHSESYLTTGIVFFFLHILNIARICSISCHPLSLTHNMLLPFNLGSVVYFNTAQHQSMKEVQEEEMHFCFLLNDSL